MIRIITIIIRNFKSALYELINKNKIPKSRPRELKRWRETNDGFERQRDKENLMPVDILI